jgi:hypothetical protein
MEFSFFLVHIFGLLKQNEDQDSSAYVLVRESFISTAWRVLGLRMEGSCEHNA